MPRATIHHPMNHIVLPSQIHGARLLPFLALLGRPLSEGDVTVDFSKLRRVVPAAIVSLAASVHLWERQRRQVHFSGVHECEILGYLQRMDFFKACGVEMQESFQRWESKGRFVPVCMVTQPIDEMGADVAGCLAPGGEDYEHPMSGLFDTIAYVLTEVGNNIRQHSGGVGYAAAQVNRQEGMIKMALADNGMGILKSFQSVEAPWSMSTTHAEAIAKALEPRISCKAGEPNEGVGLTLVGEMVSMMRGWLLVVSGNGVLISRRDGSRTLEELPEGAFYQGTLVAMSFPETAASHYADHLRKAKIKSGLLHPGSGRAILEP